MSDVCTLCSDLEFNENCAGINKTTIIMFLKKLKNTQTLLEISSSAA